MVPPEQMILEVKLNEQFTGIQERRIWNGADADH